MKSTSISAERTKKIALKYLDKFCVETYGKQRTELIKELKENDGNKKYNFLKSYVEFLSSLSVGTQRHYFGAVKSYLWSQGIKTYQEDLEKIIKFPKEIKDEKEGLDKETIKILINNSRETRKALYLTLLSSGMRVGEALQLRKRDFDFDKNPVTIRIPGKYTKTGKGRITFISSETREILLTILKRKKDDDLVFIKEVKPHFVVNEEKIFANLRRKCDLTKKYSDGKRYTISLHSFRAYFVTKCEKINSGLGHALAGHDRYMKEYERYSLDEKRQFYQKAEPELLIYSEVMPQNQKEMQERINHLEESIDIIMKLAVTSNPKVTKLDKDGNPIAIEWIPKEKKE
jgi:integrase